MDDGRDDQEKVAFLFLPQFSPLHIYFYFAANFTHSHLETFVLFALCVKPGAYI